MRKRKTYRFANAFRTERRNRGLTQRSFETDASLLGFTIKQGSIARWELGDSLPSDKHRRGVAKFLGLTLEELFDLMEE